MKIEFTDKGCGGGVMVPTAADLVISKVANIVISGEIGARPFQKLRGAGIEINLLKKVSP